jgi:hypothetical protein
MMMKKWISVFAMTILLMTFFSCGGAGMNEAAYSSNYETRRTAQFLAEAEPVMANSGFNTTAAKAYAGSESPASPQASANPLPSDRKLIKTTNLYIDVDSLQKADELVSALMNEYKAYSTSTQIDGNQHTYIIRVPEDEYDAMLNQVNSLGKVRSRSDSAEDVTLHYYDLEGRLNMRRELLETYKSYLGRADNIEEILSVEQKIAELQNEIDMYGSQFTMLNNQIDYATIVLTLYGPEPRYVHYEPSLFDRVKDLFGGYSDFLSGAAIVIVQIIIYGIPILIAAALLFWLLFGKIGLMRKLWSMIARKKG